MVQTEVHNLPMVQTEVHLPMVQTVVHLPMVQTVVHLPTYGADRGPQPTYGADCIPPTYSADRGPQPTYGADQSTYLWCRPWSTFLPMVQTQIHLRTNGAARSPPTYGADRDPPTYGAD